jgi:DNA repair exonuclease SbcCD ATPase subunit
MSETTNNMPRPDSDHGDGSGAPDGNQVRSETRIDRPHVMPTTAEPGSISEEISGEEPCKTSELDASGVGVRNQADELAASLGARLKELDRRESLLDARSERLDASLCDAQGVLNERQAALAEREEGLATREHELKSHPEAGSPSEPESAPSSAGHRIEQIERREAALLALQKELGRVYGDTFDICAAAEELAKEMSRCADRDALAKALKKVRELSANHYRAEDKELARKKRRLEDVARELAEENQRLQEHQKQLQQWAQQRELSLERRVAQLASREAKLRRRQAAADKRV